ncbi:MAG: hypothetical protein KC503_35930 [Myxococcales bacterium]|nr:hypothetical protein [Myxococcales bacterium]
MSSKTVVVVWVAAMALVAGGCTRETRTPDKGPQSNNAQSNNTSTTTPSTGSGGSSPGSTAPGNAAPKAPGKARLLPLKADPAARATLVRGLNTLTARLYKAHGSAEKSVILSPFSAGAAMALLALGGDDELAARIAKGIGMPAGMTGHQAFAELVARLGAGSRDEGDQKADALAIANSLWIKRGYPLNGAFTSELAHYYGASASTMDVSRPEKARARINAWAAKKTRQKIKEAIPPSMIKPTTRLLLVNAVYLKARWQDKFDKGLTAPKPFHTAGGATPKVQTMHARCPDALRYHYNKHAEVVRLPYRYIGRNVGLEMALMLPPKGRSIGDFVAALTPDRLAEILDAKHAVAPPKALIKKTTRVLYGSSIYNAGKRKSEAHTKRPLCVDLALPRFTTNTFVGQLGTLLAGVGFKDVFFVPKLTRISPAAARDKLKATRAVQKAFIMVDELGTVAAAVTAVGAAGAGMPSSQRVDLDLRDMRFDRPFAYVIREVKSGLILFIGHVAKP